MNPNGANAAANSTPSRMVYLGALPNNISINELLNSIHHVPTPLESIRLLGDKNCAFLGFLDVASAIAWRNSTPSKLMIKGQAVRIGWGKDEPISESVHHAMTHNGATRTVYLGRLVEGQDMLDENKLKDVMEGFGPVESVRVLKEKRVAFCYYTNVASAMRAVSECNALDFFKDPAHDTIEVDESGKETTNYGVKVNYGKERCMNSTPSHHHNHPTNNNHQQSSHLGLSINSNNLYAAYGNGGQTSPTILSPSHFMDNAQILDQQIQNYQNYQNMQHLQQMQQQQQQHSNGASVIIPSPVSPIIPTILTSPNNTGGHGNINGNMGHNGNNNSLGGNNSRLLSPINTGAGNLSPLITSPPPPGFALSPLGIMNTGMTPISSPIMLSPNHGNRGAGAGWYGNASPGHHAPPPGINISNEQALAQQQAHALAILAASESTASEQLNNRTVYLGNLAPEVTLQDLCNYIRGGLVHNIKLVPEKNCAFVSFVEPGAAALLYVVAAYRGIIIRGKRVKPGWGKEMPISTAVLQAVEQGATRNVYLGGIDSSFFEERLAQNGTSNTSGVDNASLYHDLIMQDFSPFGTIEMIHLIPDRSIGFISFTNILHAVKAVETMKHHPNYLKLKMNYGKDRCAQCYKSLYFNVNVNHSSNGSSNGNASNASGNNTQASTSPSNDHQHHHYQSNNNAQVSNLLNLLSAVSVNAAAAQQHDHHHNSNYNKGRRNSFNSNTSGGNSHHSNNNNHQNSNNNGQGQANAAASDEHEA